MIPSGRFAPDSAETGQKVQPRTSDGKTIAGAVRKQAGMIAGLLLEAGILTDQQVAYGLRIQSKLGTPRTLIHVLRELGYLSDQQLRQVLRAYRVSMRIGDLLVELGHIREADLHSALALQEDSGGRKKLGEILVENRFIDELRLIDVLASQLGFPLVDPHLSALDQDLLREVPARWYAEHRFIPVAREGAKVVVAFADPLEHQDREIAEKVFGREIIPAIATPKAIKAAIETFRRGNQRAGAEPADETTSIGILNGVLDAALLENASVIHLEPMKDRLRVRFRRDGVLLHHRDFGKEMAAPIATRLKILAQADIAERKRHQGGRILYECPDTGVLLDLRVSFFVTVAGEKVVLRLPNHRGELPILGNLGMAPRMLERFRHEALDVPGGVLIVAGPAGAGKTSTLYGCVDYLNDLETSIISAEDPVGCLIEGVSQCSIDPKIGVTYEETLRHIIRQDPDVIVLGEIRDRFSAETAIQAALTGHKVLTTFNAEDSISGLLRLLNMDIEAFLVSSAVGCVLAQRLLRRICPDCSAPYSPAPAELLGMGYLPEELAGVRFQVGTGCKSCRFTGFRGRVGIFELLISNEMVKEAILARKTSYEIRRISVETSGLVTLLEDGILKAAQGTVALPDVLRRLPRLTRPRPLPELRRILGG